LRINKEIDGQDRELPRTAVLTNFK
jgi:hypothetical protein